MLSAPSVRKTPEGRAAIENAQVKARARFQLNLQNAFENGRLQATAINPDGQAYNYRIINPRKFVLTSTFDF